MYFHVIIARHLKQCHKTETDVANAFLEDSEARRIEIDNLRNHAIFRHIVDVLEKGAGELIVCRRSSYAHTKKDYLPCPGCLTFLVSDELWRHYATCPQGSDRESSGSLNEESRQRGILSAARTLLEGPISHTNQLYDDFRKHVLSKLIHDEVYKTLKSDTLILQYEENLFRKLGPYRATEIYQRMR